jgi:2-isopropylmalate synthase
MVEKRHNAKGDLVTVSEASVKVFLTGEEEPLWSVAEGNGPVNALDQAFRRGLAGAFAELEHIHLTDYRVRILEGVADTGAVVRVLIDSTNGERAWTTIGVSSNIIEASWQALVDSVVYGLLHAANT